MSKQDNKNKSELTSFQVVWESWFIFSLSIVVSILILGLTPNSKEITDYPAFVLLALVNLLACLFVGLKKRDWSA